ncbi:SPOR domain-containing protein [Vibrio sp.]|nr:SPOR domain-containing protein [Vibrio sp.]
MNSLLQITTKCWIGTASLLIALSIPVGASAKPFICDATQASTSSLPELAEACPIGQGLWGKQLPTSNNSSFWIQCGVFNKPMTLAQAKNLYGAISTDVWMKPEKSSFRCLIGPYDDYMAAKRDLEHVQELPKYRKAFLRAFTSESDLSSTKSSSTVKFTPVKPTQSKAPAMAVSQSRPALNSPKPQRDPIESTGNIVVRKKATLDGIQYAIPFIDHETVQFYMEYDKPWNRMSYPMAAKTCSSIGMELATIPQWKKLLNSELMKKEQWPIYLPYWGQNNVGLFTSGKTSQLKGTSLLNVLCVRL